MKKKALFFAMYLFLFLFILNNYLNINKTAYTKVNENDVKSTESKNIYLTFDDGPSPIVTDKILDILKENNVKGTFFLIGNKVEENTDVVKRIYKEGHGIGLHTYTHNYKKIYKSREGFIQEMLQCSDAVYEVTGVKSNVIRFPGGSNKHLDEEFLAQLHGYGFKIYDWNMQLRDGIDYRIPPHKLYEQGTKNSDKFTNIFLLMHCDAVNKNTYEALPDIIKYYKNKGYEFQVITEDTPENHFGTRSINK